MTATQHRVAPLLDLDPDLGQFLADDARDDARRALLVQVRRLPAGDWDAGALRVSDPGHVGLLVLEGVLAREVLAGDIVSTELLGPGDLLRPWETSPDPPLLRLSVRWSVLADARVAVLDRRAAAQLAEFPEITAQLVERINRRAERLAVNQAISQLNRVDRRLLTLFWHLAERWGRMTPGGVLIPLTLSHRMLSQLIGARRPTVSTALGELAREQRLRRVDDGTWLLGGEPVGEPADANLRRIPPRRRLFARETVPDPDARVPLVAPHTAVAHPGSREDEVTLRSTGELRARLKHLRLESDRMTAELRGACATSAELCRRIHETQRRRAQERERPQS